MLTPSVKLSWVAKEGRGGAHITEPLLPVRAIPNTTLFTLNADFSFKVSPLPKRKSRRARESHGKLINQGGWWENKLKTAKRNKLGLKQYTLSFNNLAFLFDNWVRYKVKAQLIYKRTNTHFPDNSAITWDNCYYICTLSFLVYYKTLGIWYKWFQSKIHLVRSN